jgi:hypothetical protein
MLRVYEPAVVQERALLSLQQVCALKNLFLNAAVLLVADGQSGEDIVAWLLPPSLVSLHL